jgi:hypothetical protein
MIAPAAAFPPARPPPVSIMKIAEMERKKTPRAWLVCPG